MKGDPVLKPGCWRKRTAELSMSTRSNLLPDHLADSLLDVAAGEA